jgi:hypothetical protein
MSLGKRLINTGGGGASADRVAFVANNSANSSLTAINITDPSSLSELSSLIISGSNSQAVFLDDTNKIAYLLGFYSLYSIDISNPSSMSVLDTLALPTGNFFRNIDVDLTNNVAFVVAQAGLLVSIDISNPSSMVQLGTYTQSISGSYDIKLDVSAGVGFVDCGSSENLVVVRTSFPSNMSYRSLNSSSLFKNTPKMEIDVINKRLYVISSQRNSLTLVNINDIYNTPITTYKEPTPEMTGVTSLGLDIAGDYVFTANSGYISGFRASDLNTESYRSFPNLNASDLALDSPNNTMYIVSNTNNSITSLNITDKLNPAILNSYTSSSLDTPQDVKILSYI